MPFVSSCRWQVHFFGHFLVGGFAPKLLPEALLSTKQPGDVFKLVDGNPEAATQRLGQRGGGGFSAPANS